MGSGGDMGQNSEIDEAVMGPARRAARMRAEREERMRLADRLEDLLCSTLDDDVPPAGAPDGSVASLEGVSSLNAPSGPGGLPEGDPVGGGGSGLALNAGGRTGLDQVEGILARITGNARAGSAPSEGVRQSRLRGRQERVNDDVAVFAGELADIVLAGSAGGGWGQRATALAATIAGLLGRASALPVAPVSGRIMAKDLVVGGIYVTRGGEGFERVWVFCGMSGDHRFRLRRACPVPDGSGETGVETGVETEVEELADHGLAAYPGGVWHPTRRVESLGITSDSARQFADYNHDRSENLEIPEAEDDF